jgi:hypothetical protein
MTTRTPEQVAGELTQVGADPAARALWKVLGDATAVAHAPPVGSPGAAALAVAPGLVAPQPDGHVHQEIAASNALVIGNSAGLVGTKGAIPNHAGAAAFRRTDEGGVS